MPVRVVSHAVDRRCSTARTAPTATRCWAAGLPRIGVEAGVTRWWGQYGCNAALGIDTFGESAPAAAVFEHFGLTAQNLADLVQRCCDGERRSALGAMS